MKEQAEYRKYLEEFSYFKVIKTFIFGDDAETKAKKKQEKRESERMDSIRGSLRKDSMKKDSMKKDSQMDKDNRKQSSHGPMTV